MKILLKFKKSILIIIFPALFLVKSIDQLQVKKLNDQSDIKKLIITNWNGKLQMKMVILFNMNQIIS